MAPTIIIADDHAVTRQGLRTMLEKRLDAEIVAEVRDGLEALRKLEAHTPDVLILDLALPGLNGLDVCMQAKRRVPNTRIVVVSMHSDDPYVVQALQNGADAYVLKGAGADELIEAVRSAMHGDTYLSSALPDALHEEAREGKDVSPSDRYELLTEREREVFQLVAEGYTSREIGERLYISRRTVDKHRQNVMAKLNLRNQADVIRFALQRGLIPDDPRNDA